MSVNASPKLKKKTPKKVKTPRIGPEGDSVVQNDSKKSVSKRKLPQTPLQNRKASDDDDIPEMKRQLSLASNSSSQSSLGSEYAVALEREAMKACDNEDSSEETPVSPKKKKKKNEVNDESWVKAVEKSRGKPDGASGASSTSLNGKENKKLPEKDKSKNKIIDKIKKFADGKKGTKRKVEEKDKDKDEKSRHLQKKERLLKIKQVKPNYELCSRSIQIWEDLRRIEMDATKRNALCTELCSLVKGQTHELIFAHDTTRVVQCLMKYGSVEVRTMLFEELKDYIHDMAASKYAKFCVRKMLKYGTRAQKDYVLSSFNTHVRKLIRNKDAAGIIECAYNEYANAAQKSALVEEFYGPRFSLFKTGDAKNLADVIKKQPERRDTIINNMMTIITSLIDKNVCQYSIVHRVLLEYFTHATDKQAKEMIEVVRDSLIHMIHTRDGSRVAMCCIWNGSPKDRKHIIKSFKTYVSKVCMEEYGYLVLLALFDTIDDTKMVQKVILEEMMKSLSEVFDDKYGKKVLLYLMSPRDTKHFHPDIIKILSPGDSNTYSKKDKVVRKTELLTYMSPYILHYLQNNMKSIVVQNANLPFVEIAISNCIGDPTNVMRSLAELAAEPFSTGSLDNLHIIEHPAGHMIFKKLITGDAQRRDNKKVLFSQVLLDMVSGKNLKAWATCNRGCFTLISILNLEAPDLSNKIKTELKSIKPSLKKIELKGSQILYSKL